MRDVPTPCSTFRPHCIHQDAKEEYEIRAVPVAFLLLAAGFELHRGA
jgi:hypothetical protein